MCGRITRTSPREAIAKEFGVTRFAEVDWARYNAAPSQIVETVISSTGEALRTDALGIRFAHHEGAKARAEVPAPGSSQTASPADQGSKLLTARGRTRASSNRSVRHPSYCAPRRLCKQQSRQHSLDRCARRVTSRANSQAGWVLTGVATQTARFGHYRRLACPRNGRRHYRKFASTQVAKA
jgi:hypothetical protein